MGRECARGPFYASLTPRKKALTDLHPSLFFLAGQSGDSACSGAVSKKIFPQTRPPPPTEIFVYSFKIRGERSPTRGGPYVAGQKDLCASTP